jgi:transketolase
MSYEETLLSLATADPRVVVMTAENRAAIRNLPPKLGARFIDVGICEQTMIGMAAGLALRGRIPVAHALSTFLTLRAFEFIRTDVGIPGLPVKLVGAVPGFLSEANGPTHQAIEDIAIMRGIPGMKVFCPLDDHDLASALPALLADLAADATVVLDDIQRPGEQAVLARWEAETPLRFERREEQGRIAIARLGVEPPLGA